MTRTVFGGGQEGGIRSGTENMPGIAGFGAAVEETFRDGAARRAAIRSLRDYAAEGLQKIGAVINNPPRPAPHILNFSVPGFKAEPTLNRLSELGVCVSAGSACSAGKKRHSHVLTAMGLSEALLDSALRCSMCLETTKDDIDALVAGVAAINGNNQR
ncbi:Cysteine desulfurase IscS [bioreactor metagenome]|uniref:Cysteine desulfurase IscS n=1 Tax=bioreactor metagenome TaxID=1076179 RepID=A0A645D9X1_9ZZZZ